MRKSIRYGKSGSKRGLGHRLSGASRYFTHLTILVITVVSIVLATAELPKLANSSQAGPETDPPAEQTLLRSSGVLVMQRPVRPEGEGDDGSILRAFVPVTTTATSEDTAGWNAPSRGLFTYTVQPGDTLFGIAAAYGLAPETVLWSNYKELRDNPDLLSVGMQLLIPPSDGLIAVVEEGDTIDGIARRFQVAPETILMEPANGLTHINQILSVGQELFVPGGQRETVIWQVPKPVEVRRNATTGVRVYRVGVCGEVAIPPLGTGRFIYPTNRRYLSGYNFTAWHPGLDFAGRLGEPIYAADSGTVIYAGYSVNSAGVPVGYGQYAVLDHGNGYQTLYAHASQLYVTCGQQVLQGSVIAAVGSIGRSTGPHLHFEIRAGGSAVNPWKVLPPP